VTRRGIAVTLGAFALCGLALRWVLTSHSPSAGLSSLQARVETASVDVLAPGTLGTIAGQLLDAAAAEASVRRLEIADVQILQDGYGLQLEQRGESVGRVQVRMLWSSVEIRLLDTPLISGETGFIPAVLQRAGVSARR
jgi:hypothetical protein